MKEGDFVVIDSHVNATLYRIKRLNGVRAELVIPKRNGTEVEGGMAVLSELFYPNSKQREEYKDILKG
jgi:hypothetical protein